MVSHQCAESVRLLGSNADPYRHRSLKRVRGAWRREAGRARTRDGVPSIGPKSSSCLHAPRSPPGAPAKGHYPGSGAHASLRGHPADQCRLVRANMLVVSVSCQPSEPHARRRSVGEKRRGVLVEQMAATVAAVRLTSVSSSSASEAFKRRLS